MIVRALVNGCFTENPDLTLRKAHTVQTLGVGATVKSQYLSSFEDI